MNKGNSVRAIAGTLLLAAGLFTQCLSAQTTTTTTTTRSREADFSPIGLAVGETLQVNVANTAANPTATGATPASCMGSVSFYGATGAIIGSATSFTLTSGQISSVKLPYASAGATSTATRPLIRPVITLTTTFPNGPACNLTLSLETYDSATGVTHVHVEGGGLSGIGR